MMLSGIFTKDFKDEEWDKAEKANEKPRYYTMLMNNGGSCVRRYKPSVAMLVYKRSGIRLIPLAIAGND